MQKLMIKFANQALRKTLIHERTLLIVFGSLALTSLLFNLEFNLLEAKFYDFRMSRGLHTEPSKDIVLVAVNEASTQALDDFTPLSLEAHQNFLSRLATLPERERPAAIGYLVDLNQVHQLNPESYSKAAASLLKVASNLEKSGIPTLFGTSYDVTGEVIPPYPLAALPHAVALVHKDGNVFAEDKVTRRALVSLNSQSSFHLRMRDLISGVRADRKPLQPPRGTFSIGEIDSSYVFFRYHQNPAHAYPTLAFADVLQGNIAPGALAGKTVLVGTLTKEDSSDYVYTPWSREPLVTPKLAVHAAILDSMISDDGIVRAKPIINWLITGIVIAFVIWSVMNTTPLYGVFSSLALACFFIALAQLAFQIKGYWIRESQPLVGIFLAYYLVVPYRLIREYKKRWDYQRKNELLLQVEELKTNFMQLVTHDLKTPVARIQGLTEGALRKLASPEATGASIETQLKQVILSAEELNRFISSILELSRVESRDLKLNFESKDINPLVERVVQAFQEHARLKNIQIEMQLEPLFSIKIDASLISKVLSNVLDNAIKYSPNGSTITVTSLESGDYVMISVADQGIGLTEEEQKHLFTRFYRAKNDTTTKISGTGLGLYLTKYFVECHRGRVEVVSTLGHGTTFKIFLPIAQSNVLNTSGLKIATSLTSTQSEKSHA